MGGGGSVFCGLLDGREMGTLVTGAGAEAGAEAEAGAGAGTGTRSELYVKLYELADVPRR
jgi:hypothetical protein